MRKDASAFTAYGDATVIKPHVLLLLYAVSYVNLH